MKNFTKLAVLVGLSVFFISHTFAEDSKIQEWEKKKIESIRENQKQQMELIKEEQKIEKKNRVEKIKDSIFPNQKEYEKKLEKESYENNSTKNKIESEKKDTVINKNKIESRIEKKVKSESQTACYNKSWFTEKMKNIKANSIEKLNMLNNIEKSLKEIEVLVKDKNIKRNLEQQKKNIQKMRQKYISINSKIENKSSDVCTVPVLLNTYNEETKNIIENIKKQLKLLKKKG